ncbi:hypothetical protein D7V97_38345, partial [Corallococcus sp. CA053C]|uniref:hypothetical protein n=1 Tax=Corallococcus sp. CA053C TaxID=2316732 RepID=UPI000EA2862D
MKALLAVALLALPVNPASTGTTAGTPARFVFAWRGVPVGTVTLALEAGRFTYISRHLHVREGRAGERVREVSLQVDGTGRVVGSDAVPQALWLWRSPPPEGCVKGREELSGEEGPHCVTARTPASAEGTMLGARFHATYDGQGKLQALEVGESRFTAAAPGTRLRAPPELFADGVPVEGGTEGALRLVPGEQAPRAVTAPTHEATSGAGGTPKQQGAFPRVPDRLPGMTEWTPRAARALSGSVHQAFTDKGPTA